MPTCPLWRFFLALFILLLLPLAQHASAAAQEKAPLSLLSLPVAAQGAISARLGRDEAAYHARLRGSGPRGRQPQARVHDRVRPAGAGACGGIAAL
ncbi:MAG: hypothetical protein ACREV4_05610 [Gammaproteobacteria bacterium]